MRFLCALSLLVAALGAQRGPYLPADLQEGWGRAEFAITCHAAETRAYFEQGFAQLCAGAPFEAARSFLAVLAREPDCAMGHWGLALAFRERDPERAQASGARARACASEVSARERSCIEALDGDSLSALVRAAAPEGQRMTGSLRDRLLAVLDHDRLHPIRFQLMRLDAVDVVAAARSIDLCSEVSPMSAAVWRQAGEILEQGHRFADAARFYESAARVEHARMARYGFMPYDVPEYGSTLVALLRCLAWSDQAAGVRAWSDYVDGLPRHPVRCPDGWAGAVRQAVATPRPEAEPRLSRAFLPRRAPCELGPSRWFPPRPRRFTLPTENGEPVASESLRGRPQVVLFYIGNGCCLACCAQLHRFNAVADELRKLDTDIVGIGLHPATEIRKSLQDLREQAYPFRMLADPRLRTWREWLVFDHHAHEALQGTFLLDAEGRVRWREIGPEAFDDASWLVGEARRLLARGR